MKKSNEEIKKSDLAYSRGEITSVERFQKVIEKLLSETYLLLIIDRLQKRASVN